MMYNMSIFENIYIFDFLEQVRFWKGPKNKKASEAKYISWSTITE